MERPKTLAALLRERFPGKSWSELRALCERGKVTVGGVVVLDPAARPALGESVEVTMHAPVPKKALPPGFQIVFEDAHLVILEKPAGIPSVPFDKRETGTAMDLVREAWRQQGRKATVRALHVVHRIDKETSGLLCFARSKAAERPLHRIFQEHRARREYLAVVQGTMPSARIESNLVEDRGDGIRGSARKPGEGRRAVTHVEAIERLAGATLCRVRLETGRTHQIRIHLAERGHPVLGETVYVRDLRRAGRQPMAAERLMLHAATLGFEHPVTGARLDFSAEPPEDFQRVLSKLRGGM